MLDQNYLALRLGRLRKSEEWIFSEAGVCFVFPKGGEARYDCSGITGSVVSGDVLVLNGPARSKMWPLKSGEMVFWWFSLCCEHLFPLFDSTEINLIHEVIEGFRNPKVYRASSPIAAQAHQLLSEVSSEFNLDHRCHLLTIAVAIFSKEFEDARTRRSGFITVEEHMAQVFENLSVSDILELRVKELAARFGCSRRHLNRLFHRYYGMSVAALRMEMRLSKAVSLLRDPEIKIIRIAEESGFNHLGLFNACFRRRFGVTPGGWRKGLLPKSEPAVAAAIAHGNPSCPMCASGLCPWYGRRKTKAARAGGMNSVPYRPLKALPDGDRGQSDSDSGPVAESHPATLLGYLQAVGKHSEGTIRSGLSEKPPA